MIIGLLTVLVLTFIMPIVSKTVEHNLEVFLFVMGLAAAIISGILNLELAEDILKNNFLYMITAAVFIISMIFKIFKENIGKIILKIMNRISIRIFVFLLIFFIGLISSVITAIIASLLLVEIISILPLHRKDKININIVACFSIGIGAAVTPIGEPIATIVISKLNADFFFIFREIGVYVLAGILMLSIFGALLPEGEDIHGRRISKINGLFKSKKSLRMKYEEIEHELETNSEIVFRTVKIFIFVMALELLGAGFKPIIDKYVITLDSRILFWGNSVSAILDNATLAAAEISSKMSAVQIRAILIGLLVSGGMLIPGNIPNIITAGKLKIKSSQWIKLGVPLGLTMMVGYFIVLFI